METLKDAVVAICGASLVLIVFTLGCGALISSYGVTS